MERMKGLPARECRQCIASRQSVLRKKLASLSLSLNFALSPKVRGKATYCGITQRGLGRLSSLFLSLFLSLPPLSLFPSVSIGNPANNIRKCLCISLDNWPSWTNHSASIVFAAAAETTSITEEIIRKYIFLNYKEEIPYSSYVNVCSFKESKNIIDIYVYIYIENNNQKKIIIGKRGMGLKKLGTNSRYELEKFFSKKIYLDLTVKIKKWRSNDIFLNYYLKK